MTNIQRTELFSQISREWYLATSLYDAIDDGDIRQVVTLVQEKHADPNLIIPDFDIAPFHLAVGHEKEQFSREVTKLLLKNGADPNVRGSDGVTPVHVAAAWNRSSIMRLLLSYGGDPMLTDDNEKNAFHHAYEEHSWETLNTLELSQRTATVKTEKEEKSYEIHLDKVVLHGNDVEAEYRALCNSCRENVDVSKQSVATQTSVSITKIQEYPTETDNIDEYLDLETVVYRKTCPAKCFDWCEEACDIILTDECKRKIMTHRRRSKIYEYNPAFERPPTIDQHASSSSPQKQYLCCGIANAQQTDISTDTEKTPADSLVPSPETGTDLKNVENFSEDSLTTQKSNETDMERHLTKDTLFDDSNIPYIDESVTESSPSCDKVEVKIEDVGTDEESLEVSVMEERKGAAAIKHVSWSGCLSTCACIPQKLNDSDTSVYYTNPESDSEVKNATGIDLNGAGERLVAANQSDLISEDCSLELYELASMSVECKYTDEEDGIEFLEARLPLCTRIVPNSPSNAIKSDRISQETDTSDGTAYDTDYIRQELKNLGFISGPIAGTTKKLYLKKLRRIKKTVPDRVNISLVPSFSPELEYVLREDLDGWERILAKWSSLETELLEHFANASAHSSTWRSGTAKTSFTYLLLDPRISNNLPARCERMDLIEVWRTFAHAVFYVGKGTRARPYEHLHEAFRVWKESKTVPNKRHSLKVKHILEIWNEGLGVVCLQAFHNVIPAEAFTREAAMIDSIGLGRLKNEKCGVYYGVAASWNVKMKRRLGCYILYRAMRMFIANNEIQLKPTDIK